MNKEQYRIIPKLDGSVARGGLEPGDIMMKQIYHIELAGTFITAGQAFDSSKTTDTAIYLPFLVSSGSGSGLGLTLETIYAVNIITAKTNHIISGMLIRGSNPATSKSLSIVLPDGVTPVTKKTVIGLFRWHLQCPLWVGSRH